MVSFFCFFVYCRRYGERSPSLRQADRQFFVNLRAIAIGRKRRTPAGTLTGFSHIGALLPTRKPTTILPRWLRLQPLRYATCRCSRIQIASIDKRIVIVGENIFFFFFYYYYNFLFSFLLFNRHEYEKKG